MAGLLRYCRRLRRRSRLERDLDDELRTTLDLLTDEKRRAGLTPDAARRAALLELGGLESVKEQVRDAVGTRFVEDLARDARLAFRSLRGAPMVSAAAVLSLALAIGANTAVFSILNGLVLRPLPVRDPAALVFLSDARVAPRPRAWEYSFWQQIQQRPQLFAATAASAFTRFDLSSGGESRFVEGLWATGSYFETLGVQPVLGRAFSNRDDRRGGGPDGPVAVISHDYWRRQWQGAPSVIGRVLRLDDVPFTIVGVMPPDFFGTEVGRAFDVIVPLHTEPLVRGAGAGIDNPGTNFLTVVARLAAGQTEESATTALRREQPAIRMATLPAAGGLLPQGFIDRYLRDPLVLLAADTGQSNLRLQYQRPLAVVSVVVFLVLLIACVNVANLLLARAAARRRELQVRLALGASRWRLARQLFTECLVLAAAGAALGVAAAPYIGRFLVQQLSTPANLVFLDTSVDLNVLAFAVAVTVGTALTFGTLPALRAGRVSLVGTITERGHGAGVRLHGRPTAWLVATQMALSLVLVAAAGLFGRSFAVLASRDLGFEPERVLVVTLDAEGSATDVAERRALYARVRQAVAAVPDVADAAISLRTPITTGAFTPQVEVDAPSAAIVTEEVIGNLISPGWFRTFGMRIVAGRDITERDGSGAPRVAIVNETFARRHLGGAAVGRTITVFPGTPRSLRFEVVGVAADAVYYSPRVPVPSAWYGQMSQFDIEGFPLSLVRLSIRPRNGAPAGLTRTVERAIASVDPRLALTFQPLDQQVQSSLVRERLLAPVAAFFGVIGLLLAGVGLYGVTAYATRCRRAEIGIRMAVGATATGVVRLVLARIAWWVGGGIAAGALITIWASSLLDGLLYGLQPHDPATLVGAASVLGATALLAAWLPARRAVRTNPAAVLREG